MGKRMLYGYDPILQSYFRYLPCGSKMLCGAIEYEEWKSQFQTKCYVNLKTETNEFEALRIEVLAARAMRDAMSGTMIMPSNDVDKVLIAYDKARKESEKARV